jgi:hypothetical protein
MQKEVKRFSHFTSSKKCLIKIYKKGLLQIVLEESG